MTVEDLLVRGAAWLALLLYVAGEAVESRRGPGPGRAALTTLGCAALLLHMLGAFHYRYDWSHRVAYSDTARQTAMVTGLNWGGGVYANYAFAAVWVVEVIRSWIQRGHQAGRVWVVFIRGFFLFMFFNAAVIFVSPPARWFGLTCCFALIVAWLMNRTTGNHPGRSRQ